MKVSVFTPIHNFEPEFLYSCVNSLHSQNYSGQIEWVVVLNGRALFPEVKSRIIPFFYASNKQNMSVKILECEASGNIGLLKGLACDAASGDVLVELDYDDSLTNDAIQRIVDVFSTTDAKFVYSNSWRFDSSTNNTAEDYGFIYGWKKKPYGSLHSQMISFPASPQYLRRIEWAPDHVRAFLSSAYKYVGGYDKTIPVGDDHELICRFYLAFGQSGFHHINDVLYHYRIHQNNTSGLARIAEIQSQVDVNYCNYAEKMWLKWSKDSELISLDLGGRFNSPDGYISVDLLDADMIVNLSERWNGIEDNSVGVIRAYHIIEHLPNSIHFFNEAFRVLAPGGLLLIEVPSTNGMGAFSDPTHISFFNMLSFEYFTNIEYAKYIQPQYTGRFQKSRVVEYNWDTNFGKIPIVSAQLIALKGDYANNHCGLLEM